MNTINILLSTNEPPTSPTSIAVVDNIIVTNIPRIEYEVIPHCYDRESCEICGIEDRSCPICYENIQDKYNIALTSCNHLYCKPCLERCVAGGNCVCPMCRENINTIKFHAEEEEEELVLMDVVE
jgi:hypothetical protein